MTESVIVELMIDTRGGPRLNALMEQLSTFIGRNAGCTEALLAEHCRDEHGRCAVCRSGPQGPGMVWPCRIYQAAATAWDRMSAARRR